MEAPVTKQEINRRYNTSAKGRARTRRYNAKRTDQRNERRVFAGGFYAGTTRTAEQAAIINNYTREHFAGEGDSQ